ncbi:MAG TPA: response regulator [Stellaceae bacterium]|nr:response regulator [Stellaceae bacterium]
MNATVGVPAVSVEHFSSRLAVCEYRWAAFWALVAEAIRVWQTDVRPASSIWQAPVPLHDLLEDPIMAIVVQDDEARRRVLRETLRDAGRKMRERDDETQGEVSAGQRITPRYNIRPPTPPTLVARNGRSAAALHCSMAETVTVLFVDDDDQVRAPVAELLRCEGFRVFAAASALEAMRILAREPIDILFTDVVMPGQNGLELAKQARALQPKIRILFATGYYSQAANAEQMGRLLFKPVRTDEMRAALREALSHPGPAAPASV